jgi:ABC-type multidrug transport system fused ATPase/permease subunit
LLASCLLALDRHHLAITSVCLFLLPLTRAIGIFMAPIIVLNVFFNKRSRREYFLCVPVLMGYACYLLIMWQFTGNPFEGYVVQEQYPARPSIGRIFDPLACANAFLNFHWEHDMLGSFVDRCVFIIVVLSLYTTANLDRTYYWIAILFGIVPALSNAFMSHLRFTTLVFPLFLAMAIWCAKALVFRVVCVLFAALQMYCLARYISGGWVG